MFRIDCCLLALAGMVCNIIGLGIYAGYNIKLKDREAKLEKRTQKLEQKNGKEQRQIDQLKQRINHLENFTDKNYTLHSMKKYKEKADQNKDHDH